MQKIMAGKLAVFLAILQVTSVASLRCYQCDHSVYESDDAVMESTLNNQASTDTECKLNGQEYLDSSMASSMSCGSLMNACLKIYYDVKATYEGTEIEVKTYMRGCHYTTEEVGCSKDFDLIFKDQPDVTDGKAEACSCDTTECNAASAVTVGYMALVLSATVAFWKL